MQLNIREGPKTRRWPPARSPSVCVKPPPFHVEPNIGGYALVAVATNRPQQKSSVASSPQNDSEVASKPLQRFPILGTLDKTVCTTFPANTTDLVAKIEGKLGAPLNPPPPRKSGWNHDQLPVSRNSPIKRASFCCPFKLQSTWYWHSILTPQKETKEGQPFLDSRLKKQKQNKKLVGLPAKRP